MSSAYAKTSTAENTRAQFPEGDVPSSDQTRRREEWGMSKLQLRHETRPHADTNAML